jgi:hypothetical protein
MTQATVEDPRAEAPSPAQARPEFEVDPWVHFLGGFVSRHPRLWQRLGNLESRALASELADVRIEAPVYVAGLARSGSTLLLEVLNWLDEIATHRYRDFPMLHTPYAWNRFLEFVPLRDRKPVERSHRDGLLVTPDSPEALEEVLWMEFFPQLHDPSTNAVLDGSTRNPAFEAFYRDHIRKLLLVREGRRYAAKGNYNITRLEYLLHLFPDARFVLPLREPAWHIASLMKQHRLFCKGQQANLRALTHLQRVGHFEFGQDRRPINAGDTARASEVKALWARGAEVEGWARYWDYIHSFLADRMARNPRLAEACHLVRFEELCSQPGPTVRAMLEHCGLPVSDLLLDRARQQIRFPSYYRPEFSERELKLIERHTRTTAERLGIGVRHARTTISA